MRILSQPVVFYAFATAVATLPITVRSSRDSHAGSAFSYDPDAANGPAHWGSLVTSVTNECSGSKQSPIALTSSPCGIFADYIFTEGTCTVDQVDFAVENNGVKASYRDETCSKNTVIIPNYDDDDDEFELLQFHIHATSEHTVDGHYSGAELHMVHQSTKGTGQLAVVAVFLETGNHENDTLVDSLLRYWQEEIDTVESHCQRRMITAKSPDRTTAQQQLQVDENGRRRLLALGETSTSSSSILNVYDFLQDKSTTTFVRYEGSLTTPPCSEKVFWNVVEQPVSLSIVQFQQLLSIILNYVNDETCQKATIASPTGSTARPIQPLNGRTVTRSCPVGYNDNGYYHPVSTALATPNNNHPNVNFTFTNVLVIATLSWLMMALLLSSLSSWRRGSLVTAVSYPFLSVATISSSRVRNRNQCHVCQNEIQL